MKSCLLALLLFPLAAAAQPMDGPFLLLADHDTTHALAAPVITMVDAQTARIFYTVDSAGHSALRTVLWDTEEHVIIGAPELVRSDTTTLHATRAAAEGTDAWLVVFLKPVTSSALGTYSLIGNGSQRLLYPIGVSWWSEIPGFPGHMISEVKISPRAGGGWIMCWGDTRIGPPYYEGATNIYVAGATADSVEYRQPLIPWQEQWWELYSGVAVSVTPDTSHVITQGTWQPEVPGMLLRAIAGADSEQLNVVCSYFCEVDPRAVERMDDGSLLVYSSGNELMRFDTLGTCWTVQSLQFTYEPERLASHAQFGFAALWRNPSWIQLGRLGVDSTAIEPAVFFWRDGEHAIRQADVAVAADGRIHVVWTETSPNSQHATRLLIASMDWSTALSSGPFDFAVPPSSFVLSSYPNPFNSIARISFSLPSSARVTLDVFDVTGRHVRRLLNEELSAGEHAVSFAADKLPSGIYFAALRAGTQAAILKLVLLR